MEDRRMAKGGMTLILDKESYEDLKRKFQMLEEVDKTAAVAKGLQEGAKPIVAEGRANLASRNKKGKKAKSTHLANSFATSLRRKDGSIRIGFKRPGGAAAHLVDKGTAERYTKKGYYRGSVSKGNPYHGSRFWTDAVMSKGQEALQILADVINQEIIKIVNK